MLTRNDRIECAECRQKVKAQTARDRTPIPLADTPIYAGLKAEYDVQEKINTFFANNPFIHNGKKPRR